MNAIELHLPGGKPSGVWMCQVCRSLWGGKRDVGRGQARAEECCQPKTCDECHQPITGDGHYTYRHRECQRVREDRIRSERIAQAEKVEDDGSPVWWDDCGPRDGYFDDMDDLLEYLEEEEVPANERPEWVFATQEVPLPGVDTDRICEWVTDDMPERFSELLEGVAELESACQVFNAANAHLISYEPDYKRAVRVPPTDGADTPVVAEGKEVPGGQA